MLAINPFLMYNANLEEVVSHYTSIFKNANVTSVSPSMASFELEGQAFMAYNGGPSFTFTQGISLFINCDTQEEVDELWERLSEGGEKSQCGWVADKFGVWWQIVPRALMEHMSDPDPEKAGRVRDAMLKMTKIDIQKIKDAYAGKIT